MSLAVIGAQGAVYLGAEGALNRCWGMMRIRNTMLGTRWKLEREDERGKEGECEGKGGRVREEEERGKEGR